MLRLWVTYGPAPRLQGLTGTTRPLGSSCCPHRCNLLSRRRPSRPNWSCCTESKLLVYADFLLLLRRLRPPTSGICAQRSSTTQAARQRRTSHSARWLVPSVRRQRCLTLVIYTGAIWPHLRRMWILVRRNLLPHPCLSPRLSVRSVQVVRERVRRHDL